MRNAEGVQALSNYQLEQEKLRNSDMIVLSHQGFDRILIFNNDVKAAEQSEEEESDYLTRTYLTKPKKKQNPKKNANRKLFLKLTEFVLAILLQQEERVRGQFAVVKKVAKPEQIPIKDKNKKLKMALDGYEAKEIDENQALWKLEKNAFLVGIVLNPGATDTPSGAQTPHGDSTLMVKSVSSKGTQVVVDIEAQFTDLNKMQSKTIPYRFHVILKNLVCYNEFSKYFHHHNHIEDGVSTQIDHGHQQDADLEGVGRQDFTAYL